MGRAFFLRKLLTKQAPIRGRSPHGLLRLGRWGRGLWVAVLFAAEGDGPQGRRRLETSTGGVLNLSKARDLRKVLGVLI
jgi:hypothetical protein